jgi:hypothetical protein
MIKNGSKWQDSTNRVFIVIGTMIVEGKEWIYYRLEKPEDHLPNEFSCYTESFLTRFLPMPE